MDSLHEEERGARLRQRLWGAAVLIAILVIVLPLVLDGSGSESQFRRVERLREEPPRVIGSDGQLEHEAPSNATPASAPESAPRIRIGEDDPPDYMTRAPSPALQRARERSEAMTAWVVQAGSFADEANALAVRDRLRRAGYPSFVATSAEPRTVHRVQVGPMIDELAARATRDAVIELLGREALVMSYP